MFEVPKPPNRRSRIALFSSFAVHCVVVFMWLHRPPAFIQPSSIAWGMHGTAEKITYFPPAPQSRAAEKQHVLHFKQEKKPVPVAPPVQSARAGSEEGSMFSGPATGREARPALPLIFPDPAIFPWQLPSGMQGEVVVEVTIDAQGTVTDTRVLQSLKQDIDEKVIATVRNWRFRPATVDGLPISSRQDVHFHFPS